MPRLRSRFVAVYHLRRAPRDSDHADEQIEILLLQRPPDHRFAGDWQSVGGHIERDARGVEETAWQAAVREAQEETALPVERWFRIDRPESFYNPENDTIYFVPAFAALVPDDAPDPALSDEHAAWRWAPPSEAAAAVSWQAARDSILLLARPPRPRPPRPRPSCNSPPQSLPPVSPSSPAARSEGNDGIAQVCDDRRMPSVGLIGFERSGKDHSLQRPHRRRPPHRLQRTPGPSRRRRACARRTTPATLRPLPPAQDHSRHPGRRRFPRRRLRRRPGRRRRTACQRSPRPTQPCSTP